MKWMMLLLVYYFTLLVILYMTSSAPEHFRRSRFWGVTDRTNTPVVFMSLRNRVRHSYLDQFVIVFINDLLIYSRSKKEIIKSIYNKPLKHYDQGSFTRSSLNASFRFEESNS